MSSRSFTAKVFKGGAILAVGVGIFQLCNFAFRYILIHIWAPADYGVFTLIITIVGILVMSTEFNLSHTTTIFIARDIQNPRNKQSLVEIAFTFVLLVLFFLIVTFAITRLSNLHFPFLNALRQYFAIIWMLVIATGIIGISYGLLRAHKKMKQEAASNIVRGLSLLGLTVVAVYFFSMSSIELPVGALLISQVIGVLIAVFFILKSNLLDPEWRGIPGGAWRYLKGVSLSGIRSIFTFSLMLSFMGVPVVILSSIDKLMIPWLLSTEMLGFYGGALLIATIPRTITATLGTALAVYVAEGSADVKQVKKQYLRFLGIFALLAVIGYGLAVIFAQYALLLLAEEYRWITTVLRIFLVAMFFSDIFSLNATFIASIVHRRALRRLIVVLFTVVPINIGLNYFLIPVLGIEGAALATAAAFIIIGAASMIEIFMLKIHNTRGA